MIPNGKETVKFFAPERSGITPGAPLRISQYGAYCPLRLFSAQLL